jgi:hypothetical protein
MRSYPPSCFRDQKWRIKDFVANILSEAKRPQRQLFEREVRVAVLAVKRTLEWSKKDFERLRRQFSKITSSQLPHCLRACTDGLSERDAAVIGGYCLMKKYLKARFLKFRNCSLSEDAVLEAPAAEDDAIQLCLIAYRPGHFAEGRLQGKVKG